MNLVLFGPPGSGKGTQSEKLVERFGFYHISTGALLRREIAAGTTLGLGLKEALGRGEFAPDQVVIDLIRRQLELATGRSLLLDGFPRTRVQAEALAAILSIDIAVTLVVPLSIVLDRMSGRVVCEGCGAIYHLRYAPPRHTGRCDHCGRSLVHREDDQIDVIKKRYTLYQEQTDGALSYYRSIGKMIDIHGDEGSGQVFEQLVALVEKHRLNG